MDDKQKHNGLQCHIYPYMTLDTYKYVVVCSRFEGKWLLSRHKKRDTWETQGGHIERGETPMAAAQRELYEESGITDAVLYPICDYCGYDDTGHANGVVFLADVKSIGRLPESEMERVQLFDVLPDTLTYPGVTPVLMQAALSFAEKKGIR
ncbi:MAG: NUDIX domain-containing protein [Clostridia bacterium]|nr:NUDIX domain-containing protein [Clostridia bacterium]